MKLALALAVALLALASLALGPVDLFALNQRDPALAHTLFLQLRLPRTGLALLVGAGLAGSGAALQGLLRNPLASPDVLGPSTGAALGAVLVGYWLGGGVVAMALGGMAGALASLALLLALAGPGAGTSRLVLAGVAVATLLGAGISLALSLAPSPFALYDLMFWLMGSLSDRSLPQLLLAAPVIIAALAALARAAPALDAMVLGEDVVASMGIDTRRLRWLVIAACGLATGAAVAVAGSIGFVGLIVPHLVRPVWPNAPAPPSCPPPWPAPRCCWLPISPCGWCRPRLT
jgi:iron complex transport system permease protein